MRQRRPLDLEHLSARSVHGPNGRIYVVRQALGLRQVDFAHALRELGGRTSRETISHWENLDDQGQPRSRLTRHNAGVVAHLVRKRLGLAVSDELFFEPRETAWDSALQEQAAMRERIMELQQRVAELESGLAGRLLKAFEVASFLGVTPPTVHEWARAGDLPSFRLPGGAIRFRGEEVEAWLEAKRKVPQTPHMQETALHTAHAGPQ